MFGWRGAFHNIPVQSSSVVPTEDVGAKLREAYGGSVGPDPARAEPVWYPPMEVHAGLKRTYEIDSHRSRLVITQLLSDEKWITCGLLLEAKHPRFPGQRRIVDLGALLQHSADNLCSTKAQIVDDSLSEETRLDAIRALNKAFTLSLSNVRDLDDLHNLETSIIMAARKEPDTHYNRRQIKLTSEFAPDLDEFLRGHNRQEFQLIHGDQVFAKIVAIDDGNKILSAYVAFIESTLRPPLLTARGESVDFRSLNSTIHQITAPLLRHRFEGLPASLKRLSAEIAARVQNRRASTLKVESEDYAENFELDPEFTAGEFGDYVILRPTSPVNDRTFFELGRKGFVEVIVTQGTSNEPFVTAKFSSVNDRTNSCSASFSFPASYRSWLVRRLNGLSENSEDFKIGEVIANLHMHSKSTFSVRKDWNPDDYPRSINTLIRDCQTNQAEGNQISLGILQAGRDGINVGPGSLIHGLLSGKSPFCGRVSNDSLQSFTSFQAMLDNELTGWICFFTPLGGELKIVFPPIENVDESRRKDIESILDAFYHHPNCVHERIWGLNDVSRNSYRLPLESDRAAYSIAADIGNTWLQLLGSKGTDRAFNWGISPEAATTVHPNNKISLTIRPTLRGVPFSEEEWRGVGSPHLPLVVFTLGGEGVESISLTSGSRTILGALYGTRIEPPKGRGVFTCAEIDSFLGDHIVPCEKLTNADIEHISSSFLCSEHCKTDKVYFRSLDRHRRKVDWGFLVKSKILGGWK